MNIERIQGKRQKSVQDQNAISKHAILQTVDWWKSGNKLPDLIEQMALNEGISRETAILVEEGSGPICCEHSYYGTFLTHTKEFWFYSLDLNDQETEIEYMEEWGKKDINTSPHNKGTGKSFGALSLEVLSEIDY